MKTNHFIAKVGVGLKGNLNQSLEKLGVDVWAQGIADGSTTWAVEFIYAMKVDKDRMSTDLRLTMENFAGSLEITELEFVEPEGTVDDVLKAWTKLDMKQ